MTGIKSESLTTFIGISTASIMDGFDAGYVEYIISAPKFAGTLSVSDGVNGGPPFGATMKMWLERSPGFNTYNVRTPLRIIALNLGSLLGEWEWFAALSVQNKPVEMVYLRNAVHVLERPWDRMVVQQGTVDWFRFWLTGEQDPDPAKAEQYKRWRELRKMQEENEKKESGARSQKSEGNTQ